MWNANLMQRGKFIGKFLARHVSGTYAHYEEHGVYGADCARHHPHKNENDKNMFSVTNCISIWATVVVFNSNN